MEPLILPDDVKVLLDFISTFSSPHSTDHLVDVLTAMENTTTRIKSVVLSRKNDATRLLTSSTNTNATTEFPISTPRACRSGDLAHNALRPSRPSPLAAVHASSTTANRSAGLAVASTSTLELTSTRSISTGKRDARDQECEVPNKKARFIAAQSVPNRITGRVKDSSLRKAIPECAKKAIMCMKRGPCQSPLGNDTHPVIQDVCYHAEPSIARLRYVLASLALFLFVGSPKSDTSKHGHIARMLRKFVDDVGFDCADDHLENLRGAYNYGSHYHKVSQSLPGFSFVFAFLSYRQSHTFYKEWRIDPTIVQDPLIHGLDQKHREGVFHFVRSCLESWTDWSKNRRHDNEPKTQLTEILTQKIRALFDPSNNIRVPPTSIAHADPESKFNEIGTACASDRIELRESMALAMAPCSQTGPVLQDSATHFRQQQPETSFPMENLGKRFPMQNLGGRFAMQNLGARFAMEVLGLVMEELGKGHAINDSCKAFPMQHLGPADDLPCTNARGFAPPLEVF